MTNEAILDQQDIKNQDAAQEYDDNLDTVRKIAEQEWLAYHNMGKYVFGVERNPNWNMETEDKLWAAYKKAEADYNSHQNDKKEAKKYGFDLDLSQAELDNCDKMAKDVMESEAGKRYIASVTAMFNGLAKEMGIDPNDYQEDDKVPADPQEKDGNDNSNY
jgi:hypothetical protein